MSNRKLERLLEHQVKVSLEILKKLTFPELLVNYIQLEIELENILKLENEVNNE